MSNHVDDQYLHLLRKVLSEGISKSDRTGVGTRSIFGDTLRFDLNKGFPLLTTKKVHFKSVIHELLWFLQGTGNIQYLQDNKVSIWDEWADEDGNLGPVYGVQWRKWDCGHKGYVDQIKWVIDEINNNPNSRRMIVSAWNVADLPLMKLPPCHCIFQFNVVDDKLSCLMFQRSVDVFLGLPFNIASYSLLTHMIAQVCSLEVGEFVWVGGDIHLYNNHTEQANIQINRKPLDNLPALTLNHEVDDIDLFTINDIILLGYEALPSIKAEIAI